MAFLLLFVGVPLVEFLLLAQVGARLGFLNTLTLVLLTGVVGASLARQQGLGVLQRLQAELAAGKPPTRTGLEGFVVFVSGLLLLTPGFLTDGVGLLGLLPPTRAVLVRWLERSAKRAVAEGRFQVGGAGRTGGTFFFTTRVGGPPRGGPADAGDPFGASGRGGPFGETIKDATVVREREGPADDGDDDPNPKAIRESA